MPRKPGMSPVHILMTAEDREKVKEVSAKAGFTLVSDYIRQLIREDAQRRGVELELKVERGGWRGGSAEEK